MLPKYSLLPENIIAIDKKYVFIWNFWSLP